MVKHVVKIETVLKRNVLTALLALMTSCNTEQNAIEKANEKTDTGENQEDTESDGATGNNKENDEETYGRVPPHDQEIKDGSVAETLTKKTVTEMSEGQLARAKVEMKYLKDGAIEECVPELGTSAIYTMPDYSIYAGIMLHGTSKRNGKLLAEGDWKKQCTVTAWIPWDMGNPADTPYTWTYKNEHITEWTTYAMKESAKSGPTIAIIIKRDDFYDEQPVYPRPPEADPIRIAIKGSTTFLPGSVLTWEKAAIELRSQITVKDHEGNEMEVTISFEPQAGEQ